MNISLILASKDRDKELNIIFDSLLNQDCNNFEIIIVDQNIDNRLDNIILNNIQLGLDIKQIKIIPKGLSNARNVGIKHAKYSIIGFPDDDCWYESNTISSVIDIFSNNNIDGITGLWKEYYGEKIPLSNNLRFKDWIQFNGGNASSITLFFRKKVIETNLFDERIGLGTIFSSGEETELLIRLLRKNLILQFIPKVIVHHKYSLNSAFSFNSIRKRERGTGAIYVIREIPLIIILRGLISPIISILILKKIKTQVAIFIGRLEGIILFKLKYKIKF